MNTSKYEPTKAEIEGMTASFFSNTAEIRQTPCCSYEFKWPKENGPIYWNPYNNAVQCHNCGQAFEQRRAERKAAA